MQSVDSHSWRLQLGPPTLPQTVEVVACAIDRLDVNCPITFDRPILINKDTPIPVEMGLWTLNASFGDVSLRSQSAAQLPSLQAAMLRLERLTSIAESATLSAVDASADDGRIWLANCCREIEAAQQRLKLQVGQSATEATQSSLVREESDPAAVALATSEAWIERMRELLNLPLSDEGHGLSSETDWSEESLCEAARADVPINFVSESGSNRLEIDLASVGLSARQTQTVLLVGVLGVAAVAWRLTGRRSADQ
jgi:hypothetical protein